MVSPLLDDDNPAIRLALALKRLRARLREASTVSSTSLSLTQISILKRLRHSDSETAAALAAAEHVSQQAIAQNIASLKLAGLVQASTDPNDGRKLLIAITAAGNELCNTLIHSRNSWLTRAIDTTVRDDEEATLKQTIALLERLADADVR